jgi:hypothetical protein
MPSPKPKPDTTPAVDAFMATLEHPHKAEVEALRRLILGVDASVAEGVKWNAPSFRTTEYFATLNLRAKAGLGLVLHLGAKVRETAVTGIDVPDPSGLLTWLAKDRATVVFKDAADLAARGPALAELLRVWIRYV